MYYHCTNPACAPILTNPIPKNKLDVLQWRSSRPLSITMNTRSLSSMPLPRKKRFFVLAALAFIILIGGVVFFYGKSHKTEFVRGALSVIQKTSGLLPVEPDTRKEIEAASTLAQEFTKKDDRVRTAFILLQNNFELRPGGGFLGQYAVVKVKNGEVVYHFVEDANLLDQRIKNANVKVTPPWPLTRYMQLKRWMLRDSNFSPDFPTNAQKAEYFYRLGGGREKFDAVIAVNADVLDHILAITGPISIPGYSGTYSSEGGALRLEEAVEKSYLGENVSAEAKEGRKNIMKKLAAEILDRIATIENVPKVAALAQEELRNKNVQLFFHDETLQSIARSVHWDGSVTTDWSGDFLMVVDANMGALKSDFFVKRSLEYFVDFTAGARPRATVTYTYDHTAPGGDWRTSDYHTYTRIYAPKNSTYVENSRVKTGGVGTETSDPLNKTVFGYKVDVVMKQTLPTGISYDLPDAIKEDSYRLLIQKQSGIGTLPATVRIKTSKGEFSNHYDIAKDIILEMEEIEQK